jgi:PAS domain S-box-containing protein
MGRELRDKFALVLLAAISGLAFLDVFTGWTAVPIPALAAGLAVGVAALVLGSRILKRILIALALVTIGLHLGYALFADYEVTRWEVLKVEKAERALAQVVGDLEGLMAATRGRAQAVALDRALVEGLRSGSRGATFTALERMGDSGLIHRDQDGVVVSSAGKHMVGWMGRFPNFAGTAEPAEGVSIIRSTTYHWIEATAPVDDNGETVGWVRLYRRLESVYPGILGKSAGPTLSERLTRHLGHEVRVVFGAAEGATGTRSETGEIAEDFSLPDGKAAGHVAVRYRAAEDERRFLMGRGLFFASIAVLLLVGMGSIWLVRRLVGPRFEKADPVNVAAVLGILAGVRFGLALLRDPLSLGDIQAFTSYYYATQLPGGLLRSPADLVITCLFAGLGIVMVILAGIRRRHLPAPTGRVSGHAGLPYLVGAVVTGIVASGLVIIGDRTIQRVYADSGFDIFIRSPFDPTPSHILMRIGLLLLAVTVILIVGAVIGFEFALLRRYRFRANNSRAPVVIAAAIQYSFAAGFVAAGLGWRIVVLASLALGIAVVLDTVRRRKLAAGIIAIALGFALAGSAVEFPYALRDHNAKRMEAVQAAAEDLIARTDAWKISVVEEALADIARNTSVRDALQGGTGNADAFALKLWATSILGESNLTSGVYLLDAGHREIGRFSLEDIGEAAQLDAALREARYLGRSLTLTTRGTSGGREVELYVGIAPFFNGGEYLGSVVVSIPLAYTDMESMAGWRPTFFEAIGAAGQKPDRAGGRFSASLVSGGKIVSTTATDFEVGRHIAELDSTMLGKPVWLEHRVGGVPRASYLVPAGAEGDGWLLSYSLPTLSEMAVGFMGLTAGNIIIGFVVILAGIVARGARHLVRRLRGLPGARLRWSFASKLALAFVLIAIIPTLILGTASRRFLEARALEIMESRAEENLNLSRMALDRLVFTEAVRLARNPILMDALRSEPSLLGQMVTHDMSGYGYEVSSAVIDSSGSPMAIFGDPVIPASVLEGVLEQGRTYNFFAAGEGLTAEAAVPVRDEIYPDTIVGCAFVARRVDDGFSRQIASGIGMDLSFYAGGQVTASSKRELFVSELMSSAMSPDAYVACLINGRELHYSRERIGGMDVVLGYSPLRGPDGDPVGAISIPVVPSEAEAGRSMGWSSAAISYLIVIVICAIFIFGLLLARGISRPIRQLIRGTLRIGSGDLGFTIPKPSDDEIGDLVTSFNRMTAALAKSSKALGERKRYIETIIGNVGAGIISTDPRGRIDTFNAAAESILETRARNARGRDARRLLRRVGASGLAEILDEVREPQEVARKEVAFTTKDGRTATLRAIATVVGAPRKRVMGKVIVFEDVTELIRSKKLVAWSEMARQVAHEIKNPLTPMKLSAQHLLQARRDGVEDFDRVLEESVSTIVEQIESLRRIAVEFSQFSRMPARKLEWSDIGEMVEDSLSQYERAIGIQVRIVKDLRARLPKVRIDRDEVKRVFVNIVENAMQAMPEGGTLEIVARRYPGRQAADRVVGAGKTGRGYDTWVSSSEAGLQSTDSIEVAFSDTGTGILPADAGKLFEPNFSTKSHGTGLGLAISKGIMDAYGGEIVIESTERSGTRVSVRFPIPKPPSNARPPRRPYKGRGRRQR